MTAKTGHGNCPGFTLFLKARTPRKRLLEAKRGLERLYPFEVDEKNILIFKTDKKGSYDVYLSKEETRRGPGIGKICIAVLPCVLALAGLAAAARHAVLRNSESSMAQKELEKHEQEEARIQKEKEERLMALKKKYDEKKGAECEKIYPCIERIYSAMAEKATVENISIQKNAFAIEVTAKDAVGILAKLEESRAFASVKMNRSTVRNGAETVAYSGEFSRFWTQADEGLSLDGKINFYEAELLKMKARSETMRNRSLSEYIKSIRGTMHKYSCSEQYIQLKGRNDSAEIEFFVLSSSRSLLNFIREIQEGDGNLIDIKSFTFRNSENRGRLQTTVCFDTGIELKRNDPMLAEYTGRKIELSEIDRIFYKAPGTGTAAVKKGPAGNTGPASKSKERAVPASMKKLSYVGLAKSGGRNFVIAKDDEMGSVYTLPLAETETAGGSCVQTDRGYRAKIHGEYYEVRK